MTSQLNLTNSNWSSGAGAIDSYNSLITSIKNQHDMDRGQAAVEIGVGVVSVVIDTVSTVLNPLSKLIAAGLGWLIDHVAFLRKPLDVLTGNPDAVKLIADDLHRIGQDLRNVAVDMDNTLKSKLANWTGQAADNYRTTLGSRKGDIDAAGHSVDIVGYVVETTMALIAAVRSLIRDMITSTLGDIISTMLIALATAPFTFGASIAIGVTKCVVEGVAKVAEMMAKLAKLLGFSTKAMKHINDLVDALKKSAASLNDKQAAQIAKFQGIKGKDPATGAATGTGGAAGGGAAGGAAGGGATHPSGAAEPTTPHTGTAADNAPTGTGATGTTHPTGTQAPPTSTGNGAATDVPHTNTGGATTHPNGNPQTTGTGAAADATPAPVNTGGTTHPNGAPQPAPANAGAVHDTPTTPQAAPAAPNAAASDAASIHSNSSGGSIYHDAPQSPISDTASIHSNSSGGSVHQDAPPSPTAGPAPAASGSGHTGNPPTGQTPNPATPHETVPSSAAPANTGHTQPAGQQPHTNQPTGQPHDQTGNQPAAGQQPHDQPGGQQPHDNANGQPPADHNAPAGTATTKKDSLLKPFEDDRLKMHEKWLRDFGVGDELNKTKAIENYLSKNHPDVFQTLKTIADLKSSKNEVGLVDKYITQLAKQLGDIHQAAQTSWNQANQQWQQQHPGATMAPPQG